MSQQGPEEESMGAKAQKAADNIVEQLRIIEASDATAAEKEAQRMQIAKDKLADYNQAQEALKKLQKIGKGDVTEAQQKEIKGAQENLHSALIQISVLADNDVEVVKNKKALTILKDLSKKKTSESAALDIQETLGKYLLGDNPADIVITDGKEITGDFEKALVSLKEVNQIAYEDIVDTLEDNATKFGKKREEIRAKFATQDFTLEQRANMEVEHNSTWQRDAVELYQRRFTAKQIDFLSTLYSPTKFTIYVDDIMNGRTGERKQEIIKKKTEIENRIKKHYEETGKQYDAHNLKDKVEEMWKEEASDIISGKLIEVANQLYIQIQQERPDKFFEEITTDDFMHGIKTTQLAISSAISNLFITLGGIEKGGPASDPLTGLVKKMDRNLIRHSEEGYYTDVRGGLPYPRLKPLPVGKPIGLSEFVQYLNINLNHWTHGEEYFHNTRVMFNHPPGEKGFYDQLGNYAEHLKGTDIDELLLLPDGQMTLQAYHLYDKMLEEEFASLDWKHRTNQFSNQLEEIHTKLEQQVINRLMLLYPGESRERLINAVNSAVGMSRGMLLTEPEKSAYADAVDPEGGGMFASYSTNDAGSLTVFNPLHVNLRWGGEHMLPMFYFIPINGKEGVWNHKEMWKNMADFRESFIKGRGKLAKVGDPGNLFIDELIDIANVGGPSKRKGWRMQYSLDGHMVYHRSDNGEIKTDMIDALKSFKAMEMIGYEALFNFRETFADKNGGMDLLKATTGQLAAEKAKWFKYIYKRYFFQGNEADFKDSDFDNYMIALRQEGKEKAIETVKHKGILQAGTMEAQEELETSNLFLDRMITREIAARFPSKFLRIDRNRFTEKGESRWQEMFNMLKARHGNDPSWNRDRFDRVMKDMGFAEMLLRQEMSKIIRERIKIDPNTSLGDFDDVDFKLNSDKIRKLFGNLGVDEKGKPRMEEHRVNEVIELYEAINKRYFQPYTKDGKTSIYLDTEAIDNVRKYTFTFGLEDTDISLMAWRGTGPRMTARALKDTGTMERDVVPWIINMPRILNQIATSGKRDITPIIEYLQKAQNAITMVHGTGADFEFIYKISSMVIQYFKRDTIAKPLFGLFGMGKKNSIAAEYAGRSTAVWEWDSRDIDRFIVALESLRLLPKEPYDLQKTKGKEFTGGKKENKYKIINGKAVKVGEQRHVDFEYNAQKLRKEFGATFVDMAADWINVLLPILGAYLLWKYIQDALKESEGKKK